MATDLDKTTIMKKYFAATDSSDVVAAAQMFADDAVYLRSPLPGSDSTELIRLDGLRAIVEFWKSRGQRVIRHTILADSASDNDWFGEGEAAGDNGPTRRFLVHATFNSDGLISRYVALR
jgi:SnoaL-like domain